MLNELLDMPHAYRLGNNPAGKKAYYYCHHCGIELHAKEVGYVAAGLNYANGEFAPCPRCAEENSVHRDDDA